MKKVFLLLTAALWVLTACSSGSSGGGNIFSKVKVELTTGKAGGISDNGATLHASVDITEASSKIANAWFLTGTDSEKVTSKGSKSDAGKIDLEEGAFSGKFNAEVKGLKAGTKYYYTAVVQVDGKTFFGDVNSFTTTGSGGEGGEGGEGGGETQQITIKTGASSNIKENSASLSATITIPSGMDTPVFGIMFAAGEEPSGANATKVPASQIDQQGNFTISATGLTPATKYYYKAYFTEGSLDKVGSTSDFTTASISISTMPASNIDMKTATINGKLTTLASVSSLSPEVWFLWGKGLVTLDDLKSGGTKAASTIGQDGSFHADLSGLTGGYTYHYVAVTKILGKEYYGSVTSFKTIGPEVTLTISDPTVYGADFAFGISASYTVVRAGEGSLKCGMIYCSHSFNPEQGIPADAVVTDPATVSGTSFTKDFHNLPVAAPCYYAAYAYYSDDLMFFSPVKSFTTSEVYVNVTLNNTAANITANSAEVTGLVSTNLDPPSTIGTHFSVLFLYKEGSMSESEFKSWTIENMLNTSAPIKFAPYSYNIISGMSTGGSWTAQIKTNFPSKLNANTSYTVGAVAIYQKTTKDPVQYQYFFSNRMSFTTTN